MEKENTTQGVIKVKEIISNPHNPRVIQNDQLKKLKKSIMEFPEMLTLRPLILDENNVVLGGNMRLKALKELNIEETPFIKITNLTEEQKKEFVIKDNASFGEWNWEILIDEWKVEDLSDWGLEIPKFFQEENQEPEFDKSTLYKQLDTYINTKIKQIVFYFDSQEYETCLEFLQGICKEQDLESNTEAFIFLMEDYKQIKSLEEDGRV